jgi:hypothetical protein
MTQRLLASTALILLALPIAACGSSRDVEVSGEVSAASTVSVSGPIAVHFFDVLDEETPERVHAITLESPRSFQEKVALEGDSVLVRAFNDSDGSGSCTAGDAGEPWGEVNASITDDDTVKVALELKAQPCPAE